MPYPLPPKKDMPFPDTYPSIWMIVGACLPTNLSHVALASVAIANESTLLLPLMSASMKSTHEFNLLEKKKRTDP